MNRTTRFLHLRLRHILEVVECVINHTLDTQREIGGPDLRQTEDALREARKSVENAIRALPGFDVENDD
jgi:hypothetical protein